MPALHRQEVTVITIESKETTTRIRHLARVDCAMATCDECGHRWHVHSRVEAALHWLTCSVGRRAVASIRKHAAPVTR